jgi:electron transfer flavoprotein alpha subunit
VALSVAVLIKQVPLVDGTTEPLKLGPDGRLVRQGIELEINPFCRRAITKGVELAASSGGRCSVLTLGPPPAEDALLEALAAGADDAALITDADFAGSDTLATARALAACLRLLGPYDLILAGLNSVDADTGQVGPEVAELLGLPFASGVRELALEGDRLSLLCERDDGTVEAEVDLPAVVSVAERLTFPAKHSAEERAAVDRARLRRISSAELGPGPWGEVGSPTRVGEVRLTGQVRLGRRLDGTLDEQLDALVAHLLERGALSPGGTRAATGQATNKIVPSTSGRPSVLVIVEPGRPRLARELLGAAAVLAGQLGGSVVAAIPVAGRVGGAQSASPSPSDLASFGADQVVEVALEAVAAPSSEDPSAEDPSAEEPSAEDSGAEGPGAEDLAHALGRVAEEMAPQVFLAPSTSFGREIAARFAAAGGFGLTGDATSLEIADGRLVAWKPAFGGELEAAITAGTAIQGATVRPGALPLLEPRLSAGAPVQRVVVERPARSPGGRKVRYGRRTIDQGAGILAAAPALVGVGAGVDPSRYGDLGDLLGVLGASLVATRKVTDKGWLPRTRQVGLTGVHVDPPLYVAIGISGRTNHVVGLRHAGTIVAVNNDPGAAMFEMADYGVVGDWQEVVPALTERLRVAFGGTGR